MADITRKTAREKLEPRREPYWLTLAKGCALGFRRGPDTWIARYTTRTKKPKRTGKASDAAKPKQATKQAPKLYKALTGVVEYHEAKKAAEEWFSTISGSGVRSAKRDTVRAACETYLADLRRHGRGDAAVTAQKRFKSIIYGDPIADVSLEDATKDDFLEWRERLRPGRQPRSINRHVRGVVAALNRAVALGHIGNPDTWRMSRLADDVEDEGETAVFLSPGQRKALIAAASNAGADFFRAIEQTGARPSEIAAAKAGDFDGERIKLSHKKGRPPKLRHRYTVLGPEGLTLFARMAKGKLPSAPLLTEDGQQTWRPHVWAKEFRRAAEVVNETARGADRISPDASTYSFRHARISELLQVHGIDPLTVANQTGTSLQVIEKHYFRFIASAMRAKLAQVRDASN